MKHADKIVGLFVLVAILGLVGVIIFLGANQHWFTRNIPFYTVFRSAKGLVRGMPVTFKGFEIGRVRSFELDENNSVVVEFYIYDTYYPKVTAQSIIELASNPLGSSIIFYPGKEHTEPLKEHSLIPAIDSSVGKDIVRLKLAAIPAESEDQISAIMKNVDDITSQLDALVKNNANELDTIIKSLSRSTFALAQAMEGKGSGPISQTLVGLSGIVKNLNTLTTDMNGLIPKLLDPTGQEVYPAIKKILDNIQTLSEQLRQFSEFLNGTQPQIAGILAQIPDILNKGRDVMEGIANNPLLSGGITKEREQPSTFKSFRDEAF
ncbi:MAG: MCE family protein [Spirochaetales bacterium]|nr:MCE family protein [Spirochaetales bacterium]